jgi:uncharacterized protein YlxW (UPF0749 family)
MPERPASGVRRLGKAFFRPGRGQIIAALILFVVGMAGVMQIRINTADSTYRTARREDLISLLDGLGTESRRLDAEIAELERTRTDLQSGADTERAAREATEKRILELSILAGTAEAEGPGIRIRIADPRSHLTFGVLLNAVGELRDAGAEVIEINDSVRVVASTWFGSDPTGALLVDGKPVTLPLTIEAIGDPHSLEEGARFRGGIVSEIESPRIGGQVSIAQLDRVFIGSLHDAGDNQYARPVSTGPTPR